MQQQRRRAPVRAAGAIIALACLLGGANAPARHHSRSGGGSAGEFDYYLLSLSWSPAFCLDSPDAAECNGPRRFGFIVHGLWPQGDRNSPQHCDAPARVPDDVVDAISDLMPSRSLVYHEWSAHGSCSGLPPADFFSLVRRARAAVVIPAELAAPGSPIERTADSLAAAFLRANPRFPAGAVLITCSRQDVPRLREVRICLDRDLAPRACSGYALRGACRSADLIVPPVR